MMEIERERTKNHVAEGQMPPLPPTELTPGDPAPQPQLNQQPTNPRLPTPPGFRQLFLNDRGCRACLPGADSPFIFVGCGRAHPRPACRALSAGRGRLVYQWPRRFSYRRRSTRLRPFSSKLVKP